MIELTLSAKTMFKVLLGLVGVSISLLVLLILLSLLLKLNKPMDYQVQSIGDTNIVCVSVYKPFSTGLTCFALQEKIDSAPAP